MKSLMLDMLSMRGSKSTQLELCKHLAIGAWDSRKSFGTITSILEPQHRVVFKIMGLEGGP